MKLVKSLLLGTAAGLTVVGGAQAADLPVKKAIPIEYVRVCTAYGAGFFYIPGTDTCLRVSGRARAEYGYIGSDSRNVPGGGDLSGFTGLARFNIDARTQTGYGTLRAFLRLDAASRTGHTKFASGTNERIGYAFSGTGQDQRGRVQNFINVDKAFVQFAGLTAGRASSFFDFYAADYEIIGSSLGSNLASTNLLAYTQKFGEGWSATISMEDPNYRKNPLFSDAFAATAQPGAGGISGVNNVFTTAPSPIILATNAAGNATAVYFVDAVQRSRMPDFVGTLRYDALGLGSALGCREGHQHRRSDRQLGHHQPAGSRRDREPGHGRDHEWRPQQPSDRRPASRSRRHGGLADRIRLGRAGRCQVQPALHRPGRRPLPPRRLRRGRFALHRHQPLHRRLPEQRLRLHRKPVQPVLLGRDHQPAQRPDRTVEQLHRGGLVPPLLVARVAFGLLRQLRRDLVLAGRPPGRQPDQHPRQPGRGQLAALVPDQPFGYANSAALRDTYQVVTGASLIWSPVKDLDIGVEGQYIKTGVKNGRVFDANRGGNPFTVSSEDVYQARFRVQRDF